MTGFMLIRWWLQDMRDLIHAHFPQVFNVSIWKREGRMIAIGRDGGGVMGYPSYTVYARRGGFIIGRVEYRNQWGYYAFYPPTGATRTPMNAEILAEIYAFLRELRVPAGQPAVAYKKPGVS